MQCGSKSVKILAFLWIQHILTYAGELRFAPFPDIGQENYKQKWLWTNLIHIFWTLTAKRFHGYYLSDFTLNIFGYDPFGNKMQISTIFCEMICRPAAAMILPTTIFLIAHLNRDTWIFFRVTSKLTRCYLFDIQLLEKWKRMIFVTPRRSFLWLLLDGQAANFWLKQAVHIPKALHVRVHLRYFAPF